MAVTQSKPGSNKGPASDPASPHANGVVNGPASQRSPKRSNATVSERAIDEGRKLKLIYIGAGISGIVGTIEFLKRLPDLDLVIYEKNWEVGGTWLENRYPGCACGKHLYTEFYSCKAK